MAFPLSRMVVQTVIKFVRMIIMQVIAKDIGKCYPNMFFSRFYFKEFWCCFQKLVFQSNEFAWNLIYQEFNFMILVNRKIGWKQIIFKYLATSFLFYIYSFQIQIWNSRKLLNLNWPSLFLKFKSIFLL